MIAHGIFLPHFLHYEVNNMERKYPNLCKPITLGRTTFRNRMFSAPMGGTDITNDGCIGPKSVGFYELRSKGGAAAVTVSECMVHPSDGSHAYNGDDCGSSMERNGISTGSANKCDRISAWSCAWRSGKRRYVRIDPLPECGMGTGFDRFSKQRRGYSRFRHGCEGICGRRGIFGSGLYAALHRDHIL